MTLPTVILPEFDMIDMIIDMNNLNNWGIDTSSIFVGKLKQDFTGRYQIGVNNIGGSSNPKYNFDTFNFTIVVQALHPQDENLVASISHVLHDSLIGKDTTYFRNNEVSYQQFNSTMQPNSIGMSPENKPTWLFRINVNRQIHVNYANRIPI